MKMKSLFTKVWYLLNYASNILVVGMTWRSDLILCQLEGTSSFEWITEWCYNDKYVRKINVLDLRCISQMPCSIILEDDKLSTVSFVIIRTTLFPIQSVEMKIFKVIRGTSNYRFLQIFMHHHTQGKDWTKYDACVLCHCMYYWISTFLYSIYWYITEKAKIFTSIWHMTTIMASTCLYEIHAHENKFWLRIILVSQQQLLTNYKHFCSLYSSCEFFWHYNYASRRLVLTELPQNSWLWLEMAHRDGFHEYSLYGLCLHAYSLMFLLYEFTWK
jgi:hypothetical protein